MNFKGYMVAASAMLIMPMTGLNGVSAQSDGVYRTVLDCKTIKRDSARHKCFDIVTDGDVFTVGQKQQAEKDVFGREELDREDRGQSAEVSELETEIVSVNKNPRGRRLFTTSDGQKWRQVGADHMAFEKAPFKVVIKKGLVGSYNLVSVKYPKVIRVKRIK